MLFRIGKTFRLKIRRNSILLEQVCKDYSKRTFFFLYIDRRGLAILIEPRRMSQCAFIRPHFFCFMFYKGRLLEIDGEGRKLELSIGYKQLINKRIIDKRYN